MRSLKNKPKVIAPTSTYPHGRIQDDDGSGTKGTPVDEQVYGDFHQFFSELMKDANLTPNELPENEYDGFQLNLALALFINKLILSGNPLPTKIINIGDWNMNGVQAIDIPHGISDYTKIRSVSVVIRNDAGTIYYPLDVENNNGVKSGGVSTIQATTLRIQIYQGVTSFFNPTTTGASFINTGFNRGFVTIQYSV